MRILHQRTTAVALASTLLFAGCKEDSVVETPLDVADIVISGGQPSLLVGQTMQLQATPRSASGKSMTARTVNWSTSSAAIAEVDAAGLVRGRGAGPATITARSGSAQQTFAFTVVQPQFTLTVAGAGGGNGTVQGNGVQCTITAGTASGTCSVSLNDGTSAVLTATPNTNHSFGGWTGCTSTTGNSCTVAMTQARTVTASFLPPQPPTVRTIAATGVGPGSAQLNGGVFVTSNAAAGYAVWFELGVSPDPTTFVQGVPVQYTPNTGCPTATTECLWFQPLAGLTAGTTYYFRIAASNPAGTARGTVLNFTTPAAQPPTVTTDSVTLVTSSSFRTHGTVVPNGANVDVWFQVSTVSNMTSAVSSTIQTSSADQGPRRFTEDWTGGAPGTVYYYRVVARNSAGTQLGLIRSVTTAGTPAAGSAGIMQAKRSAVVRTPLTPVLSAAIQGGR